MRINEVVIDNIHGAGATSNNQEVDYKGLRVSMTPTTFLSLTPLLDIDDIFLPYNQKFKDYIGNQGAIGAPFLVLDISAEWKTNNFSKLARVVGHEGRHRMHFIKEVEGNIPIEVHLFFTGLRNKDITPEWVTALNRKLVSQTGKILQGPFFTIIN